MHFEGRRVHIVHLQPFLNNNQAGSSEGYRVSHGFSESQSLYFVPWKGLAMF